MADASGELLVVLLDCSLFTDASLTGLQADILLQQLLVFLKAHQLLSEFNHQAVMAVLPGAAPMLYTPADGGAASLAGLVTQRLRALLSRQQQQQAQAQAQQQQQLGQAQPPPEVALSGALSRALCYANRFSARYGASARHRARPRVLSIVSAADTPLQYIPVMNAIFAAQASGVVLDALVAGPADSAFLQQAAHITGGLYLRPQHQTGLLEYLLGAFAPDTATRELLSIGSGTQVVDYRASCFCHKTIIDTGYICSVCLSIFCKANMKLPACPTCGTEFKRKGGAQPAAAAGAAAAKPAAANPAAAAAAAGDGGDSAAAAAAGAGGGGS